MNSQNEESKKKKTGLAILWQLFSAFFRIGILTFGGGLTMLPMLKYEIVEKHGWTNEEQLMDIYAIGQCTPGIIAVNTATYVGYLQAGIIGGFVATLGMITPSLLIITLVAAFLKPFMDNVWIQHALMGVRGAVCALMLNTAYTLAKKSLVHPVSYVLCILAFIMVFFLKVTNVLVVIIAGVAGILLFPRIQKGNKEDKK